MIAASGKGDVYGVAQERMAGKNGYAVTLQGVIGCGVKPFLMAGEEICAQFLQANNVCIGNINESNQFGTLLLLCHVAYIVGYDGNRTVTTFVVVGSEVQRTIVKDISAYDESADNGHPYQTGPKEQPEDDKECINTKEDGKHQRQKGKTRKETGRDKSQCHTQPHQQYSAEIGTEKDADGKTLE